MSAEKPGLNMPPELENFSKLEGRIYSDGSRHVFGIEENGKMIQLKGDDVIKAYGYESGQTGDVVEPISKSENNEAPGQSLYDEYRDAVQNGDAKDTDFRKWLKNKSLHEAARWYTDTRSHGEAYIAESEREDGPGIGGGRGDIAVDLLSNKDHQERLNAQEGKENPTEDDVAYYKWQHDKSGHEEETVKPEKTSSLPPPPPPPGPEPLPPPPGPEPEPLPLPPGSEKETLPEDLVVELTEARHEYARLTVRRRDISTIGHKKELEVARKRYESAINRAGAEAARILVEAGADQKDLKYFATDEVVHEIEGMDAETRQEETELNDSKRLKVFYDWWARQGGKLLSKGTLKKGMVMAGIGSVPGLVAGLAGAALLGPVGGAVVGAALARGVARSLTGAKINKEADARSVGQVQSQMDSSEAILDLGRLQSDELPTAESITSRIEQRTNKQVRRNRRRMGLSAVIGALGGAIGAGVGHEITGHLFNGGGSGTGAGHSVLSPEAGRGSMGSGSGSSGTDRIPIIIGGHRGGSIPDYLVRPEASVTPIPASLSTGPNFTPKLLDARYPWTHMTEALGVTNGTPEIMKLVTGDNSIAEKLGYVVKGHGGGGKGVIDSITTPEGKIFTDNGHINALLDYFYRQSLQDVAKEVS